MDGDGCIRFGWILIWAHTSICELSVCSVKVVRHSGRIYFFGGLRKTPGGPWRLGVPPGRGSICLGLHPALETPGYFQGGPAAGRWNWSMSEIGIYRQFEQSIPSCRRRVTDKC